MRFQRMRCYWITGLASIGVFLTLWLIRTDAFQRPAPAPPAWADRAAPAAPGRESWMRIFQNQHRIGFSHTRLLPKPPGYELEEKVMMRLNTMGMLQDIRLRTRADLSADLSLERFEFDLESGSFRFAAQGAVSGDGLGILTETAGHRRRADIPVRKKVYLTATLLDRLQGQALSPGERYTLDIFDPATLSQAAVTAEVIGREQLPMDGASTVATRIRMSLRGMTQTAWISDDGEVLRERGLLGLRLEKATAEEALRDLGAAAIEDLAEAAAVTPDRPLSEPQHLDRLRVRIGGARTEELPLNGGRQLFSDGILAVHREDLADLPALPSPEALPPLERAYLRPEPFIQSDHASIRALVRSILGDPPPASALAQTHRLMDWIDRHIEKRPGLSMPDALSTLENRMGDCNEIAMLFAAMARAAGIPARVEAGLVYRRGRFYYHAWNLLFLGRWVTADAAFGQLPADVTHLRLATGSTQQQVDLAGAIGNLTIHILDGT